MPLQLRRDAICHTCIGRECMCVTNEIHGNGIDDGNGDKDYGINNDDGCNIYDIVA